MGKTTGPDKPRYHSLKNKVLMRVQYGKLTAQKWPKPQGRKRHPKQIFWSDWLRQADILWKYQPAGFQIEAQKAAAGGPLLPRDLFIAGTRGRLWSIQTEDGRVIYPMAGQADVSESLSFISQVPGTILIRGQELWEPIPPGNDLDVLTFKKSPDRAEWEVGGGGGNVFSPPQVSNFTTWVNQGGAQAVQAATGSALIQRPAEAAANVLRGIFKAAASPPASYIFGIRIMMYPWSNCQIGIALRDNTTGRMHSIGLGSASSFYIPNFQVRRWNSPTSIAGTDKSQNMAVSGDSFFRINDDGVNLDFQYAPEDGAWSTLWTAPRNSWLAALDEIGFYISSGTIEVVPGAMAAFHFRQT